MYRSSKFVTFLLAWLICLALMPCVCGTIVPCGVAGTTDDAGANAISVLVVGASTVGFNRLYSAIADAHVFDLFKLPVMFISRTIAVVIPMASASLRFLGGMSFFLYYI
jgi:hypothetical protein